MSCAMSIMRNYEDTNISNKFKIIDPKLVHAPIFGITRGRHSEKYFTKTSSTSKVNVIFEFLAQNSYVYQFLEFFDLA